MKDSGSVAPVISPIPPSNQAIFQQQWRIYRILVDNNYLFHREALACLHQVLVDDAPRPYRLLDLGCGDAAEIVRVLAGTPIAHYRGVDLSRAALDLAAENVATLGCPVALVQDDFLHAVTDDPEPADVAWLGLALHHFETSDKLRVMRAIRGIVGDRGLLLLYEPACPDGETRSGYLDRWDAQQSVWTAYSHTEWETITAHVHAADFPETPSSWRELGHEAGFSQTRELYVSPTDMFRMYRFGP